MMYMVIDVAAESYGAMTILKNFYSYAVGKKNINWCFVVSGEYINETLNIKVIVDKRPKRNWFYRLWWEFTKLPKIVKQYNPDRIISLQNIIAFRCNEYPQLLFMHMPHPFQNTKQFSLKNKNERIYAVYQKIIGKLIIASILKADMVVVQGQWLKQSICRVAKKNLNDKIFVLPSEVNIPPEYKVVYFEKDLVVNSNFFYPVAPSTFKNHICIFKAIDFLHSRGIDNFKVYLTVDNSHLEFPNYDVVVYLGSITREQVLEQLQTSVLLFPSYIETYGLPLIEARSVGCIEFVSDTDFAHEALDDYDNAYFFDPFKPEQLADLMEKVITDGLPYKYSTFKKEKLITWDEILCEFEKMT